MHLLRRGRAASPEGRAITRSVRDANSTPTADFHTTQTTINGIRGGGGSKTSGLSWETHRWCRKPTPEVRKGDFLTCKSLAITSSWS